MEDVTEQIMHDWLLQRKPEGASHDPSTCAMCTEKASKEEKNVSDSTLTQEQHKSLLESAVSDAVAAAKAEVDAEILRLNELLEEAKTSLAAKEEEIATLKTSIEERDEAERLEALANERVQKVAEVASFSDEQVKARREDWAEMSEEAFEKYLGDLEAVAKAAVETKDTDELPGTDFDGTRETAGEDDTDTNVVKTFFDGGLYAAARS